MMSERVGPSRTIGNFLVAASRQLESTVFLADAGRFLMNCTLEPGEWYGVETSLAEYIDSNFSLGVLPPEPSCLGAAQQRYCAVSTCI